MAMQSTRAVPAELTLKGLDAAGNKGREWRRRLPETVALLVEQWSLQIDGPFPGLSYNYVAPVTRVDGTPAALKVWLPDGSKFQAEVEALRLYAGDGAIRLLEVNSESRAMLLERADHETDLWRVTDEEQRIGLTAELMARLWRPPPPDCSLLAATAMFERMALIAPRRARDEFPLRWVATAKSIFDDLEASAPATVLHEDLHPANILSSQREPWLVIDPHGLIGPPALDTIQMILNVIWQEPDSTVWPRIIARYVDALAAALSLDRDQIRLCGVARAVLQAFWTLDDYGTGWEKDIAAVEAFARPN